MAWQPSIHNTKQSNKHWIKPIFDLYCTVRTLDRTILRWDQTRRSIVGHLGRRVRGLG